MARKSEDEGQGTDLTVHEWGGVPAQIDENEVEGLSGLGYSEKAEDSLVPILSILQEGSGEVKTRHAKYIEGATPGMLIIRSLKKLIPVSKEQPLPVQPCGFTHYWVQWRGEPGEGQVINQYPFEDRPHEAEERPDPQNEDRTVWFMPNGDRLVDTRYHYCQIFVENAWMPVVIPMGGTNHTVSRSWTAQMKMLLVPGTKIKAPAWFSVYGFHTDYNSRGSQSWFTYGITPLGWVQDRGLRDEGRRIFESLEQGVIMPDVDGEAGTGADESPV